MKRYRTLDEDIVNFITSALKPFHEQKIIAGAIEQISDLGKIEPKIYKWESCFQGF